MKYWSSQIQRNSTLSHMASYLWLAIGAPCGQDITPYGSKLIFWKIIVHSNYCWEKRERKKISPFPATHTYIKLTLISFPPFFAPFPNYFKLGSSLPYGPLDPSARREGRGTILTDTLLTPRFAPLALSSDGIWSNICAQIPNTPISI